MTIQVRLKDIIEELEMQIEGFRTFLNAKTGEVISVSEKDLRAAEDEEPFDHLPDWQQENLKAANDIIENFEDYKELPTKYEVNEYEIMEDFCLTVRDQRKQNILLSSIKGKGAFRRFKDKIVDFEMEDEWYLFRDEHFKQLAIEWCRDNNLNYIQ